MNNIRENKMSQDRIWWEDIVDGMSEALFVSAYADMIDQYCEENGCSYNDLPENVPYAGAGEDWMNNHPPISDEAKEESYKLARDYESQNKKSLDALLEDAVEAEGMSPDDIDSDYASYFGHYLGMMALGHGVSWFDDHKKFPLVKPNIEFYLSPEDFGLGTEELDMKEFASHLLEFHSGQDDPVYAIGSSLFAGNFDVLNNTELVNDAIYNLELLKDDEYEDELDSLIDMLKSYL